MKLRFRGNTLRLRVNQREARMLAGGLSLREEVLFPNLAKLQYVFEPRASGPVQATFEGGIVRVVAPLTEVRNWARSEAIGLYFEVQADDTVLKVSIEKDLECTDGTPETHEPDAFPRTSGNNC